MDIVGYIASLGMGIILGTLGGGGSILTVPILVYLFKMSPTLATGHSLLVVGVSALIGSLIYLKRGEVDFKLVFSFGIPSILGVGLSRTFILPNVPDQVMLVSSFSLSKEALVMAVFSSLMIAASYSMIKKKVPGFRSKQIHPLLAQILIPSEGFLVGMIAGFVGAGGGFLIIPALVFFAGAKMRIAVGTSLMIIAFQSLFGFAADLVQGAQIQWPLVLSISAIAITGILAGTRFSHKIDQGQLKTVFGWFILGMGTLILIQQGFRL